MSILNKLLDKPINNRTELLNVIRQAAFNKVFDMDSLPIIEATLQFGDMRVKDILLPRHEVDVIYINATTPQIIQTITQTGHSRFPVVNGSLNDVVGVFHSKDIVHYIADPDNFKLIDYCRKAFFVPDLKPLDSLLYEMRLKQIHLALIVDEFTNVVGIVTLEMILEQIVGEIDDEHDSADNEHMIVEISPNTLRVKGFCGLEQLHEKIDGLDWNDSKVETVSGYITKNLGRVPTTAEKFVIDSINIEILHADSRKINSLIIKHDI